MVLQAVNESLRKIEITNQICADKAQMQEWRECLRFAAAWHGCSPVQAYQLWRHQKLRTPSVVPSAGAGPLPPLRHDCKSKSARREEQLDNDGDQANMAVASKSTSLSGARIVWNWRPTFGDLHRRDGPYGRG